MPIIFENIDTGESIAIDRQTEGKFYGAKLSAAINSSNMSVNSDRGQDYGWRLQPEQQAIIEQWEEDPDMIDKVSAFTKVQTDSLAHADFLTYYLYQQELGKSPEKKEQVMRRENQADYDARVQALRSHTKVEAMKPFVPLTMEEFMGDDMEQPIVDNTPEAKALLDAADVSKTKSAPKAKK